MRSFGSALCMVGGPRWRQAAEPEADFGVEQLAQFSNGKLWPASVSIEGREDDT